MSILDYVPFLKKDPEDLKKQKEQEETEKLTEEENKEKTRLNHQAYLMFNWERFTSESANRQQPFKYFGQVMHSQPAEINNKIFKRPVKYDILLNSKSVDLSYFVPKIRLFKEYSIDESSSEVFDVELPIYQQYKEEDFNNIFKDKSGRGGGVGLKSFKWNSIGTSQGNQYSFGAEIELFFENISEITKVRSIDKIGKESYSTSFEDLLKIMPKKTKNSEGTAVYNPNYYRIKALIGWYIPKDSRNRVNKEMIKEIERSNISLYMTLHSHELNIAEDSTATLKIKYIAYVEALMDNPKNSNIFYPQNERYEHKIQNLTTTKESVARELAGSEETPVPEGMRKKQLEDQVTEIEELIKKEQNTNKIQVYQRILNYIYNNNLIKYTTVNPEIFKLFTDIISRTKDKMNSAEQIENFNFEAQKIKENNKKIGSAVYPNTSIDAIKLPQSSDEINKNITETIEAANARLEQSATNGDIIIPYFYIGDLIDSILQEMYGPNKDFLNKDIKLLLGPLVFYDYGRLVDNISLKPAGVSDLTNSGSKINVKKYSGAKTIINIADIPISLDIFSAWFTKKIVDAGVVNKSMKEFINDIMTDLVIRSVGVETYSFAPRQKTRLVYKTKTLKHDPKRFFNTSKNVPVSYSEGVATGQTTKPGAFKFNADDLKLWDDSSVEEINKLDNIILIYSISDQSFELLSDYDTDIKKGIRHIAYGAETGLIKNINFTRQDNPLIRSHNMRLATQEGGASGTILRDVYNANVEMFGNSLFELGELIYVSPTLFGSTSINFAKDLGIGGYFMILKINNLIEDGKFNTSLELRWNAKGDGKLNDLNDGRDANQTNKGVVIGP